MLPNPRIRGTRARAEKPGRPREDTVTTSVGFQHLTVGIHLDRAIESQFEVGGLKGTPRARRRRGLPRKLASAAPETPRYASLPAMVFSCGLTASDTSAMKPPPETLMIDFIGQAAQQRLRSMQAACHTPIRTRTPSSCAASGLPTRQASSGACGIHRRRGGTWTDVRPSASSRSMPSGG
jgi:hypothetical protein